MLMRRNNDMSLRRWSYEPLPSLLGGLRMLDDVNRLFEAFDHGFGLSSFAPATAPRVQLVDTGSELRLYAELPGFGENDIELTVQRNSVTLRGRRQSSVPEGFTVRRRERGDVEIMQSYTLPCRIDADRVEASLQNGVLLVTMPKAAEEQPRQIPVKTA